MEPKALLTVMVLSLRCSSAFKLLSGQTVCRRGVERPCYKIAYYKDASRRLGFKEAEHACQSDGGVLLSIESENEQQLVEKLLQGLSAGDGDFWIGLSRRENGSESSAGCPSLYQWLDGSDAKFRNWYVDEPSCGSEVCVVMYHQPSASSGMGGPYLYQWNDDRCNMKNNFICKYAPVRVSTIPSPTLTPSLNRTLIPSGDNRSDADESGVPVTEGVKESPVTIGKSEGNSLNIIYIIIPTIPLLLLLLVSSAVFCFRFFVRRRKERSENVVKEHSFWMEPVRTQSPNLEIYNIIRKQSEADLTGTHPHINTTSFRTMAANRGLHSLSGEYDNVDSHCSESGFVTNDIYESCSDQASRSRESGWVENGIYGY